MNFFQTIPILFIGSAIAATMEPALSQRLLRKQVSPTREARSYATDLLRNPQPDGRHKHLRLPQMTRPPLTVGEITAFRTAEIQRNLSETSRSTRPTEARLKLAQALAPEQINLRAKQITVRIDGANLGSGVIIEESNNVYIVLTNWHVMQYPGQYTVQTIDGRQHQVNPTSIRQIKGLDLAIVKFDSEQNYQVAEVGDSSNLVEGQSIYFSGYPGELREEDSRYYRFFAANLVGILPNSTANGYSLIYNGEAFPGMSGGPVLDRYGNLIGIHGEANINAVTGGTSNYAIPIAAYQQAIARGESPLTNSNSNPNLEVPEVPEIILETQPTEEDNSPSEPVTSNSNQTADSNTPSQNDTATATATSSETDLEEEQSASPESGISSIPTFSDDNVEDVPEIEHNATEESSTPLDASENRDNNSTTSEEVALREPGVRQNLVSTKTSIDYKPLRELLKAKQWEEADRQTYQLIDRIIESAKQQNQNIFIELKTIAEFSCTDIRTIDSLWQKYSGEQFGFTPQQKVWQNVNQEGDFSTETWRRFATKVGWKQGEVASAGGYLLYDQLNFNPEQAPEGHLPWWFALPEEQQNVIKHLFARCNLDPASAEANSSNSPNNADNSPASQSESQPE
ncbi:GUN4 domain-containing protein [Myxosarcina sp. GI1(2024)]